MKKLFRNKLTRIALSFLAILILLFSITVYKDNKSLVESGAGAALTPVQKVMYSVNKRVENFIDFYLRYDQVKNENEDLLKKNLELEAKIRDYEKIKQENITLNDMFEFKERRNEYDYIGANIINQIGEGIITSYTIDKGTESNIEPGMVIMIPDGIVGQVVKTAKKWSIVETISSENISIHVKSVENNSNAGIFKGYNSRNNDNKGLISFLPIESDLKKDDTIVTSGLGRFYPPDIYIGKVISVNEDKGNLMKRAVVQTTQTINKVTKVFIIVPKNLEDIEYWWEL